MPNNHQRDDQAAADAFDAEMAAEIEVADAELLASEGPDALTSERARRLSEFSRQQAVEREAALRDAAQDFDHTGYVLAAFRAQRGWTWDQLADWLGVSTDDLARLAATVRPAAVGRDLGYQMPLILDLARAYGAHPERLYTAFNEGDP